MNVSVATQYVVALSNIIELDSLWEMILFGCVHYPHPVISIHSWGENAAGTRITEKLF